jgi:hypothetical protein
MQERPHTKQHAAENKAVAICGFRPRWHSELALLQIGCENQAIEFITLLPAE